MIRLRRLRALACLGVWVLTGCESTPTPTPGPTPTATVAPTPAPSATPTPTPPPTETPVPTPTEGPVRTPIGGPAGPEVNRAVAAMDAAPSYRYRLLVTLGPPEARYVLTGTGTHAPPASYDTNFSALGFNNEILIISNTTYVRSYGVWRQGDPDPALFPLGGPPRIPSVSGLVTYAQDAGLAGDGNETLEGRPVRHYRFRLRSTGLLGPGGPDLGTAGGDLWADTETHRFVRLLLNLGRAGAPTDNGGTLQMDFSDYGIPATLTPPPTVVP